MLYTGKGDGGTSKTFGDGKEREPKNAKVFEALGSLDELNSLLGVCKVKAGKAGGELLAGVQQSLFIIQAELAGADKKLGQEKVAELEKLVNQIEGKLPPIKSFLLPGGTELSAFLDYARTVARRAERRVVAIADSGVKISKPILVYLNRLSSFLYALARLINNRSGIIEERPHY